MAIKGVIGVSAAALALVLAGAVQVGQAWAADGLQTAFVVLGDGGRAVVTWDRGGRTCVLSSPTARPAELLTLADWRGKGTIPFQRSGEGIEPSKRRAAPTCRF